jgi:S-DNA-T family DNA segregation ATPase FtsK/SpoIIIE
MLEKRSHKQDVVALILLALAVFLAISLLSYNPADPPSTLVYPQHTKIANACGRSGALTAEWLLQSLGLGAYFLVFSLAALDAALLSRRQVSDPWFRATGWAMALLGITTLLAMGFHGATPGPVIGPGGYLGAAARTVLEMHFARAGAFILAISLTLAGLLLSTDYLVLRASYWSVWLPLTAMRHVSRQVRGISPEAAAKPKPKLRADDIGKLNDAEAAEPDEKDADGDLPQPAVRIRGKRVDEAAEEPEDEAGQEESEEESGDEADEKQNAGGDAEVDSAATEAGDDSAAKSGIGARLASALRIRNLPGTKDHDSVIQQLEAASRTEEPVQYELPPIDLLLPNETVALEAHEQEVRQKAKILEKTFANFGFKVKVVEIETGPVIAQYEIELEAGLRLAKITNLADDLAIALRVPSVRIVAPIPGKNTVGIEVPNNERQLVRLREVIEEADGKARKMRIPIYLGKDVSGNPLVVDLSTLPHLLIAGRTGTGKSVCLNSIIVSMLMSRGPDDVRMLMIDPKMVELSPYKRLPHLMHPVVTDMRKAEAILAWAVEKMEERYALLARAGVRHIGVYNQLGEEELLDRLQPETEEERAQIPLHLPYIVIVADEIADLMMTSGKEVEQHIIRLAQKSRAIGIHLVLATQKPTVDVITGLIKSNLPARIAFQVASRTDSRVVLDEMGADKLLGNGDMLFLWPGTSTLLRGQGTYLSDDEINKVVDFVATTEPQFVKELVQLKATDRDEGTVERLKSRDEFYEAAVDIVIREGRGSVSLLQRALGIGYGRAARLIDFMAEDGIVGTYNGSQAREVLITLDQWSEMIGQEAVPEPPRPKRNRILPEAREQTPFEATDSDEEAADENDGDEAEHETDQAHGHAVDAADDEDNGDDDYEDEDQDDEDTADESDDEDDGSDGDESDSDDEDEEEADEESDGEDLEDAADEETEPEAIRVDAATGSGKRKSKPAGAANSSADTGEPSLRMHSAIRRQRRNLLRPRD